MATENQTRRSLSISDFLMEHLQEYATANDRNVSDVVEQEMRKFLKLAPRAGKIRKVYKNKGKKAEDKRVVAPTTILPVSSSFVVNGETEQVQEVSA